MITKFLNLSKHSFSKYFYSSCSVKEILETQPANYKKKLKVTLKFHLTIYEFIKKKKFFILFE